MGTGSQLLKLLMEEGPSAMEFLKAYNIYMSACYFKKVAHIFSALTIERVMKGKSRLHVVDYGIHCAFQWAGLVRWLAKREGGPPSEMKIAAICCSQPSLFPVQWIEEQQYRLSKYASELGLPFVFEVVTTEWEKVCIENLNLDADEVLVVSDLFNFSTLKDEGIFFGSPNPRDTVLSNIKKMRPDVFIQSVLNCSHGSCFLSRFREMLFYYSALFDMLDAVVPRESEPRSVLEQDLLGCCALNAIACEGVDVVQRPEKYRQWQSRNQRAGLRQLPLRPVVVEVLKDQIKKHHHKGFYLSEDGQWLLQGWKGRILIAHLTWVVEDGSSE
ncbi:Scarecrow-like protein 14 [Dichanthelium oligosanthes]|uniref:Scarecrow-like protein 14 n=1 Tax=Dichanthelium oligosanthes TaxID=888268 RepID=A0A1E5V694_9POAL|nr:Scarecrow-like protein 14 [Dichanthelium oligosanthes]